MGEMSTKCLTRHKDNKRDICECVCNFDTSKDQYKTKVHAFMYQMFERSKLKVEPLPILLTTLLETN